MPSDLGPELAEYRAVSRLAVAALILGLASVLALITPVLWFLPVLAVITGLAALLRIKHNPSTLIGRKAALIAIALGVTFGVAAPARAISRGIWLGARAQRFADAWFDFLRAGQSYHAHQLTRPAGRRLPLDEHLPDRYTDADLEEEFEGFLRRPVTASLLRLRDRAVLSYLGSDITYSTASEDVVKLRYELAEPDKPEPIPVSVTLLRTVDQSGKEQWQITGQAAEE